MQNRPTKSRHAPAVITEFIYLTQDTLSERQISRSAGLNDTCGFSDSASHLGKRLGWAEAAPGVMKLKLDRAILSVAKLRQSRDMAKV